MFSGLHKGREMPFWGVGWGYTSGVENHIYVTILSGGLSPAETQKKGV